MKRIISILIVLTGLGIFGLYAQDGFVNHTVKWYEDLNVISVKYDVPVDVIKRVNALQCDTLKARQVLRIPTNKEYWDIVPEEVIVAPASTTAVTINLTETGNGQTPEQQTESNLLAGNEPQTEQESQTGQETQSSALQEALSNFYNREGRFTVRMAVLMPFDSQSEAQRRNSIEFYCGALMAIRDAGNRGINIFMDALDYPGDLSALQSSEKDVVIGPIQAGELEQVLASVPENTLVVSPLDRKADKLLASHSNLIQAAPSTEGLFTEAIRWAKKEHEDKPLNFILIKSETDPEAAAEAATCLRNEHITSYKTCICKNSGNIPDFFRLDKDKFEWGKAYSPNHQNIVIVAISNEAVLNNAIRNIAIAMAQESNITAMCNNKAISYESIPIEDIHKAETHSLCPYFIDYTDERTLDFIHKYRAFFNAEPTRFSFQGYDVAMYMARTLSQYGISWSRMIGSHPQMQLMQTNFSFSRSGEEGGLINNGLRKVIMTPDYKVLLVE